MHLENKSNGDQIYTFSFFPKDLKGMHKLKRSKQTSFSIKKLLASILHKTFLKFQ